MRKRVYSCVLLLLGLFPASLDAQLPFELVAEARFGYAFPLGQFSDPSSFFTPAAGPTFSIGGGVWPTRSVGIFGSYQQARFGCGGCADVSLDDSALLSGLEAGVDLAAPVSFDGVLPRFRAALLQQALAFSSGGERLASTSGTGFSLAAGASIPLASSVELAPWARFLSVPADFTFSSFPDRSVDVTAFSIEISLAFRL